MRIRRKSIMHLRPRPYRARAAGTNGRLHPGLFGIPTRAGLLRSGTGALSSRSRPPCRALPAVGRNHGPGLTSREGCGAELWPVGTSFSHAALPSGRCSPGRAPGSRFALAKPGVPNPARTVARAGRGQLGPASPPLSGFPPSQAERCAHARFQAGGHFVPQPARSLPLLRMFFPGTAGGASDRPPSAPLQGRVRRGAG